MIDGCPMDQSEETKQSLNYYPARNGTVSSIGNHNTMRWDCLHGCTSLKACATLTDAYSPLKITWTTDGRSGTIKSSRHDAS